jgi:molybdenum cofactor cytidylyltransferase
VNSAGLILAAGESRRMGAPKALLGYRGETFLARLVRLFSARCSSVTVVLGAVAEMPVPAPARAVVNASWRDGQTSSMQCGLRAVPPDADGVLFTLVDHPAVEPATIDALLAGTGRLRIPRFGGRRGHPIWFSRELISELLAVPPGGAARDAIRAHYPDAEFVDVSDAGILADIDDRAAYETLLGAEV